MVREIVVSFVVDGGGPDPSPASEENPSGDTGNVAPAFYSFPVILNAKPGISHRAEVFPFPFTKCRK